MLIFICFLLVWIFVLVPLYQSYRKVQAAKVLNEELDRLAQIYVYALATYNVRLAQSCAEQAKEAVQRFTSDIRLTAQELTRIAPAVTAFPNWQAWL